MAFYQPVHQDQRPPHGGFWWRLFGWWRDLLVGTWGKPARAMTYAAPVATGRGVVTAVQRKHTARKRQRQDMATAIRAVAPPPRVMRQAPAGWYPSPVRFGAQQWWDGSRWADSFT